MTRSCFWRWLCALAAVGAATGVSAQPRPVVLSMGSDAAEPEVARPAAANRVVRLFDFESRFEDPARAEIHPVPRFWSLAQDGMPGVGPRPGFPLYNKAELDETVAFGGTGSVRLSTQGGSVSLRLSPGAIPVFAGAEYMVSARVLTRGLTHARAAVRARYLDKANKAVPGSETVSELVVTAFPDGKIEPVAWRSIAAVLPSNTTDAAYLQIELEILQPQQFRDPDLPKHQLWPNDFPGEAWFDDVAVVQLPRVRMFTASPTNVLHQPQRPTVSVSMRDMTGEAIDAELTLQDAAGRIVDAARRPLGTGQARWDWEPKVRELGWYRATLELRARETRIGATYLDFVWLPSDGGGAAADRSGFVLLVDGVPDGMHGVIPDLAKASGAGSVVLPAWSEREVSGQDAADRLAPVIEALSRQGREVALSLPRVPPALAAAAHVERDDLLGLLSADQKVWGPMLLPLLDKYGQSVQRWHLGSLAGSPRAAAAQPAQLEHLRGTMSRLVPGPVLGVPWPAEVPPQGIVEGAGELVVRVPYSLPPAGVAMLAEEWRAALGPSGPELLLVLEPLPRPEFSRLDSAAELARRVVTAWAALDGAPRVRLGLPRPWEWPAEPRLQVTPQPEIAVWHNLVERLAGRRVVGRLPAGPGIACYILAAADGSGALAAWREEPGDGPSELRAYLGEGARSVVDLFGNATAVSASGTPAMHRIPLSDRPVFVEGVDAALAQFVASFRVDPEAVPATVGEHEVALVLSNPFAARIDGRITVLEPGGLSQGVEARDRSWTVTPRSSPFSIGPGETARIPISVAFSPAEEAGPKDVIAEVELSAERAYGPVRLATRLEIRLKDLELDLAYRRSPTAAGPDLVLEAHVTNRGTSPATLELTAFAPDYPRARASVADLAPGQTATRRFALPGGTAKLRGQRVVVGLQDVQTGARVNRSIPIE